MNRQDRRRGMSRPVVQAKISGKAPAATVGRQPVIPDAEQQLGRITSATMSEDLSRITVLCADGRRFQKSGIVAGDRVLNWSPTWTLVP
jgi:hypothetical protein